MLTAGAAADLRGGEGPALLVVPAATTRRPPHVVAAVGRRWPSRARWHRMALEACYVVVTATLAPIGATPFAGLISWMGSLRPRLQKSVAEHVATDEEQQVLHLIEFAALRFGDPLLHATSVDDLDDRLDALTDSPEALHCTELLAPHMPLVQASLPMSAALLAAARGHSPEEVQGQVTKDPQRILESWLDAQRQAAQLMWGKDATHVSEATLTDIDLPIEIEKLIFHGFRANFCGLAIEQVFSAGRLIEMWLAGALADRLMVSAQQHLRLLASLPGVLVDETIVPDAERLDFAAIEARHQRAKAASQRSYERARARLGS